VWVISISSSAGFVPALHGDGADVRYLGVRVRPVFTRGTGLSSTDSREQRTGLGR
jgi:hypothetical protein